MKDTENITQQIRKDKALTLRILKLFLGTAKKCVKKMRASMEQSDWKGLKAVAHKHIPTYSKMGLDDLAESLKYIEANALKKDKHGSVQEIIRTLHSKNSEAMDAVRQYIGLIRNEDLISDAELYSYGI